MEQNKVTTEVLDKQNEALSDFFTLELKANKDKYKSINYFADKLALDSKEVGRRLAIAYSNCFRHGHYDYGPLTFVWLVDLTYDSAKALRRDVTVESFVYDSLNDK